MLKQVIKVVMFTIEFFKKIFNITKLMVYATHLQRLLVKLIFISFMSYSLKVASH